MQKYALFMISSIFETHLQYRVYPGDMSDDVNTKFMFAAVRHKPLHVKNITPSRSLATTKLSATKFYNNIQVDCMRCRKKDGEFVTILKVATSATSHGGKRT